jgi:CRP-like cAMP-binding protein
MFTSKLNADRHKSFTKKISDSGARLIIPSRNLFLAALPRAEANHVIEASRALRLQVGDVIYEDGSEIDRAYFPVDSIISSLALLEDGSSVEISMTGREGIIGLPALVGGGRALHWTRVSVGGTALRISTVDLRREFDSSESIHNGVLRAYRSLFKQICQRSVCNSRHTLLQRLCVYLLMLQDRLSSDELPITQEEIASRISVRRAGVSTAASMIQAMQGITSRRGKIVIVDRDVLVNTACECYRVLRQDFEDMGGWRCTTLSSFPTRR